MLLYRIPPLRLSYGFVGERQPAAFPGLGSGSPPGCNEEAEVCASEKLSCEVRPRNRQLFWGIFLLLAAM